MTVSIRLLIGLRLASMQLPESLAAPDLLYLPGPGGPRALLLGETAVDVGTEFGSNAADHNVLRMNTTERQDGPIGDPVKLPSFPY